jgi:hypothetical protein
MATTLSASLRPTRTRILFIAVTVVVVLGYGLFNAQQARSGGGSGTENGIPAGPSSQAQSAPLSATGSCKPALLDYVENTANGQSTTSRTFVDLPGTSVTFTQGGTAASCVEVDFTAMTFAPGGALLQVQPVLDGATLGVPSHVQLSGDDDENANGQWSRSHAFDFIFPSVAPGSHTMKMQFQSVGSLTVIINRNAMLVRHHK